ncbi:folate-binding protein YgfZ [soil metagenome]
MEAAAVVEALVAGRAFADLTAWRKVAVSGREAFGWLNDLASADISDLAPGRARRSLLLSPTGRIRAEFTVAVPGGNLLLIQDPAQPTPIETLLAPYVLSSDVELEDRTDALALYAFPGRSIAPDTPGTAISAPSCAGAGVDLLALAEDHGFLLGSLSKAYKLAGSAALEAWRIAAGIPRFGVDALEADLPQEGGFAEAVSFDKGCYLGQEAVAKVRNLGHPRRMVVHLTADIAVSPGDAVEADGERVGEVTSASASDGHWWLLARVRWASQNGPLRTERGTLLTPVPNP